MTHMRPIALLATLFVAFAVACGGGDAPPPTATPEATSAATANATPSPIGTPTLLPILQGQATPKSVQDLVVAVVANDAARVAQMAKYQQVACTTTQGAGGPPKCSPGTAEGTVATVFPTGRCQGEWTEDARGAIAGLMAQPLQLYAAATVRPPVTDPEPYWPKGQYVVIFNASTPSATAPSTVYFILDDTNVLRAHAACDTAPGGEVALLKSLNAAAFLIAPR